MTGALANKRVALIGGAGFIGHNLALALAGEGARVDIIDGLQVNNLLSFTTSNEELIDRNLYLRIISQRLSLLSAANIPLHIQDSRDYHGLSHLLGQLDPQVVIHLAAVSHAGRSNKDPYSTFDHSLRTLENALDYSRNKVEHFIFLSSSMVYGNFLKEEVDEDHPLNPMGIYGALKVAGEKIVMAYQQVFNLPYTILRPSALYGPRCVSRRVGQIFIENALHGQKLRVDGDGSERLDFTYIDDLVYGLGLVIKRPEARNQIFNLTYGSSRSIGDLLDILRQHFPDLEIENVERDKLMPFRGTLSVQRARQLLGYEPQNPVEVGFPKYIRWYQELMQEEGQSRERAL
jgi:nucleoside-diphosphate-sugar epimerase